MIFNPDSFFLLQILRQNPASMSFSVQSCCVDSPPEPREISTKLFIHSYYTRAALSLMVMVMLMLMLMLIVQSFLFTLITPALHSRGNQWKGWLMKLANHVKPLPFP